MVIAFTITSIMTIIANGFIALGDIRRFTFVVENSAKVGVPESWLTPLGVLKAVGAFGLLLGLFGVPWVGIAASLGLSLLYVGAIATHMRAGNYAIGPAMVYLLLALTTLTLGLAI